MRGDNRLQHRSRQRMTRTASRPSSFAQRVIDWQRRSGRHHLPWQGTRDPYRVWLSEIMLQQTQVATVLPYYERFVARYADVHALAAPLDDDAGAVERPRLLQPRAQPAPLRTGGRRAARRCVFPRSAAALATAAGIGRSTAAAIAAFCFGERVAILDGNVKRVLTRVLGFGGDPGRRRTSALWTSDGAAARARHRALRGPDGPRRDAVRSARPTAPPARGADCRPRAEGRQPRALPGEVAPPGARTRARIGGSGSSGAAASGSSSAPHTASGRAVDAAAVPGRSVRSVCGGRLRRDARGVADARAPPDAPRLDAAPARRAARKPVNAGRAVRAAGWRGAISPRSPCRRRCAACSCRWNRVAGRLSRPRPLPRRYSSTIFSRSSGSLSSSSFCLAARPIGSNSHQRLATQPACSKR